MQPVPRSLKYTRLGGYVLPGDDLARDEIAAWYDAEKEAFADMVLSGASEPEFSYRQINQIHAYRHLPSGNFGVGLGLGSATGEELLPISPRVSHFTIMEPSAKFKRANIGSTPADYRAPDISGRLPFEDRRFGITVCFSALHHVPNVTTVIRELIRVTAAGGYVLLREPIVSMRQGREKCPGLTPKERGIPLEYFREILAGCPVRVKYEGFCFFPLFRRLGDALGFAPYNSRVVTRMDAVVSRLLSFNVSYEPRKPWERLMPASVAYVLERRG